MQATLEIQSAPDKEAQSRRMLEILRAEPLPVFALLDAARDPRVLNLLRGSGERFQSLYEGPDGEVLAEFAPYLVALPPGSALREALAQEGWGESWGVYLTCDRPFAEVRRHFRHFLLVHVEGGEESYFRFYDPRVLRLFLPACNPAEAAQFFGPVACYLTESDDPDEVLRFTPGPHGAQRKVLPERAAD